MNATDPEVSVIILTYNSEGYILRALRSLERQTFSNFEVIIVDAGSTDRTHEIVLSCGLKVTWLELPNSDMGMARNYGVRNSKGRYLMFLDSDDFYLENKIISQVDFLNSKNDLDAVFGPAYIYRTGKRARLGTKSTSQKLLTLTEILSGNCYTLGTMCVRKSAWERGLSFSEGPLGRYGEDWRFQLNMSRLGFNFGFLPVPGVVVELRSGSHTSWTIQAKMKELALLTVEEVLRDPTWAPGGLFDKQIVLDGYRFKLVISLLLLGRKADAEKILEKIKTFKISIFAKVMVKLGIIVPVSWFSSVLIFVWTVRQNRSFSWVRPPQDVDRQFSELGVPR